MTEDWTDMDMRFERLVVAYGADPALWPEAEREALSLWLESPDGAAALDATQAFEKTMRTWAEHEVDPNPGSELLSGPDHLSDTLIARLLNIPDRHAQPVGWRQRLSAAFTDLFDLPAFAAPRALALQGATLSLLFVAGLAAGQAGLMDSAFTVSPDEQIAELDLSDGWFGDGVFVDGLDEGQEV